jgi:probable HAF family extracellular repeat protein
MRHSIWVGLAIAFAGLHAAPSPVAAQTPRYVVEDLGLQDDAVPVVMTINDHGEVVGFVQIGWQFKAVRYRDGYGLQYLPGLESGASQAWGNNAFGEIAGEAQEAGGGTQAFRFRHGSGAEPLGTLGGFMSSGRRINAAGAVAGFSFTTGNLAVHAFVAEPGMPPQDLGTLGGSFSVACGINDAGQVAGQAATSTGAMRAFRYHPSDGMVDLGTLGGTGSWACGINATGTVAGQAQLPGNMISHAFRQSPGGAMEDLDTLGSSGSAAEGINDDGTVVGWFTATGGSLRAFLFEDGTMVDLNDLIDAASGWELMLARDINNAGQIIGEGFREGLPRAYRLTPVADPADTEPPVIHAAAADRVLLWPANGAMVPVSVQVSVTDNVDESPACGIASVWSNEGAVEQDVRVTGGLSVDLRAKRTGSGAGRTYTIEIVCADEAGNTADAQVRVHVPHDQSGTESSPTTMSRSRGKGL